MEPLMIVLQAIQLGASLIGQGATNEIGKDLYLKLKSAITRKSSDKFLMGTIEQYECKPEIYAPALQDLLDSSGLSQDQEILEISREIVKRENLYDYRNNQGNINVGSGTMNVISGGNQNFGSGSQNNFSGDQINHYESVQPSVMATTLIQKVSSSYKKLENLPPGEANNLWMKLNEISSDSKLTRDFYPESNQSAQLLKIFQLLVAYCCYFSNRSTVPPGQFKYSTQNEYYRAMKHLVTGCQISTEIDSIVRDKNMAYLLLAIR
jgi:hypothetical protein